MKLKPVFGIQPKVYLTAVYGVIALVLVFLIFFLPGISAGGTYITFTTEPVKAGVWIDGVKTGVTPCEILVKQGTREITISRPFYKPVVLRREVGGFVFALPFLPKRETIATDIVIEYSEALAAYAFQEFSHWALVESFSEEYHYPPVLTDAVSGIKSSPSPETIAAFSRLLDACLPYLHNKELADDYIDAVILLETRGASMTPSAVLRLVSRAKALLDMPGQGLFLLYAVLPDKTDSAAGGPPEDKNRLPRTRQELAATPGFQKALTAYSVALAGITPVRGATRRGPVSIEGVSFVPVASGRYVMGRRQDPASMLSPEQISLFPHPVSVDSFLMARTEITNAQFKRFIDETPEWKKENSSKLAAEGLVTRDYLKDWDKGFYPAGKAGYPVTYVSAYAAEAYCKWLTGKAAFLGKVQARLPLEAEWEWAATAGDPSRYLELSAVTYRELITGPRLAGSGGGNSFGIQDMSGNVFEWCSDWFAISSGVAAPMTGVASDASGFIFPTGGGKAVRGGSWVTPAEEVFSYTRGTQPPDWCTPYLGFRPVIAEPGLLPGQ